MTGCPHCPPSYTPRGYTLAGLHEHLKAEHPEMIDARMPVCPTCGIPCEPDRSPSRNGGWFCHYCGLWGDQAVCPTCHTTVPRQRLPKAAEAGR